MKTCLSLAFGLLLAWGVRGEMPAGEEPDEPRFQIEELGLLPIEREQIANRLAGVAVRDWLQAEEPSRELRLWTDRLLAFALSLHPRNPRALSAVRSLRQQRDPRPLPLDMDSEVLAEFLYKRSRFLVERGGESNHLLVRYLVELAARLDPYHEDAVYQHELHRLDGLAPVWSLLLPAIEE